MSSSTESDNMEAECLLSDSEMEVDEESSDDEEEEEQLITLFSIPHSLKRMPKKSRIQAKDPLMVVKEDEPDLSNKTCVCCHCTFKCDNDADLLKHISEEHGGKAPSYTCPFCSFETSNLVDWITHKGVCETSDVVTLEDKTNSQCIPKLNEIEKSSREEPETNRRPLIKVKPEFNMKSIECQLENNSKSNNDPVHLVINCYPTLNQLIPLSPEKTNLKHLLKPLEENNCRLTLRKKKRQCLPPNQNLSPEPTLDIFREDVLEVIRNIIEQHWQYEHNYFKINFFRTFGLMKKMRNGLMRAFIHLRKKILFYGVSNIKHFPELIAAAKLLQQIQQTINVRRTKKKNEKLIIKPIPIPVLTDQFESPQINRKPLKMKINTRKGNFSKTLLNNDNDTRIEQINDIVETTPITIEGSPVPQERKRLSKVQALEKLKIIKKTTYHIESKESKPKATLKSDESSSKTVITETEDLEHTCKKLKKRKKFTQGRTGYWTRVKGGFPKPTCAACAKEKQKE